MTIAVGRPPFCVLNLAFLERLCSRKEISMARRRNWAAVIQRLNQSRTGELTLHMGSPGSAQVTRCRLLAEWKNLEATTVGPKLKLRLRH